MFGRSIATTMPRLDVPLFASSCHPVIGDDLRYEVAPLVGRSIKNQVIRKLFSPQPVPHRFSAIDDLALRPGQIRAASEETALMVCGRPPSRHFPRGTFHLDKPNKGNQNG